MITAVFHPFGPGRLWTSFGQLASLTFQGAPALQDFAGIRIHAPSDIVTTFDFDAAGGRARQVKERINLGDARVVEKTLYLGSYEREIHATRAYALAPPVPVKTVHRHSLGTAVYTRTVDAAGGTTVKLATLIQDHLGSTDLLLTGTWDGHGFANPSGERQSFDAWGERRDANTWEALRAAHTDPFHRSAEDHARGYTGHEQLDDSGLIHMNGRIYDPEIGRFLSPDPIVQVPEYSQGFNRYSYVLNNPLNAIDPSGYSWLSKAFKKVKRWVKENWRTVVVIVVAVVATVMTAGVAGSVAYSAAYGMAAAGATGATAVAVGTAAGLAAAGAIVGMIAGGLNAALHGGDLGDVLRGALVGGIQGALAGPLHQIGGLANIAGHGIVGGAANVAMGGKFGDGFLSAAAGAATAAAGWSSPDTAMGQGLGLAGRTTMAAVAGGTVSVLGGGKFANGAYTAAFQHLVNAERETMKEMLFNSAHDEGKKWHYWVYDGKEGPIDQVADGSRQCGPGSLRGQCATAAQVLCGKGSNHMPKVRFWRAGPTIFELWERGYGVPVGMVMASFNGVVSCAPAGRRPAVSFPSRGTG